MYVLFGHKKNALRDNLGEILLTVNKLTLNKRQRASRTYAHSVWLLPRGKEQPFIMNREPRTICIA